MEIDQLQKEFNIRYYYWALDDFNREITQGFPFIQGFKNESPWCVMKMMSEMDNRGKAFFAKSLVKRFHEEAVIANGETITADEQQLCELYFNQALQFDTQTYVARLKYGAGKDRPLASRAKIKKLVKNEFTKANVRVAEEGDLDGILTYRNTVDAWSIITRIYTRDKDSQISYDHTIWSVAKVKPMILSNGKKEMWSVRLGHSISFLSWLGITGQTSWRNLADADCSQVAEEITKLYFHFLRIAPKLLKGFSP